MKFHAQCFCIKVVPYSASPQIHIATLPLPNHFPCDDPQAAWEFLLKTFSDYLPKTLQKEEELSMSPVDDCIDDGISSPVTIPHPTTIII